MSLVKEKQKNKKKKKNPMKITHPRENDDDS